MTEQTDTHIDTVLYHRSCRDGGNSAWCCYRFGGLTEAEYKDVAYYEDPPWDLVDGKHVLIVDFSYKRDVLMEMNERAASLTVLDHHKSAQEDLAGLDYCVFDMNKSGAMLAWDWCLEHRRSYVDAELGVARGRQQVMVDGAPWPLAYAQDYDLWRHELPDTHLVSAVSEYQKPDDFDALDSMYDAGLEACFERGRVLYGALLWEAQDIADHHRKIEHGGMTVAVVNCSARHWSRALHLVLDQNPEVDFGMAFIGGGKNWTHTLRSRSGSDIDVSLIARAFGGGGHKHASGFKTRQYPQKGGTVIDVLKWAQELRG